MTSKQRVLTALKHRETDKVPFDIGGTYLTGIHHSVLTELMTYWGETDLSFAISERSGGATVPDRILEKLEVDVRSIGSVEGEKTNRREDDYYYYFTDEWNLVWRKPKDKGLYFDLHSSVFNEELSVEQLNQYSWPDGNAQWRFQGMQEKIDRFSNDYAIVIEGLVGGELLEGSFWMRGYENLYCDMLLNEKEFLHLLDKKLEVQNAYWKTAGEKFSDKADIVRIGDDLGEQNTTRIAPDIYRKLIKPRHKELIENIRSSFNKDVFVFYHSCGAISELIPDLIEIGVDILNPVQYTLPNMGAEFLKKEFGQDLSFWGGGIDTQNILPFGTPADIEKEVARQMEVLSKDGGFVFAAVHNIQHGVPVENLLTLIQAVKKYRVKDI